MEIKMLLQLAVRNLFRNRRRTLLTILLVALAVIAQIAMDTYINGMVNNVMEGIIKTSGHIRIQNPKFTAAERSLPLQHNLSGYSGLKGEIQDLLPEGAGFTGQIHFPSMLYGPSKNTTGVGYAIEPEAAARVLQLPQNIVSGRSLEAAGDEVVLGKELAQRLDVKVGDEVSVFGKTQYGSFAAGNLTVVGIADLGFAALNRIFYLPLPTGQYLLEMDDQVTNILVMIRDDRGLGNVLASLRQSPALAGYDVILYTDNPLVQSLLPIIKGILSVLLSFFVIIGVLGIVNTMFMSVLERTHEIAVMGAMGLKRRQITVLIMLESGVIGILGSLAGLALGLALSWYSVAHGIALGSAANGLPVSVQNVVYGQINPLVAGRSFLVGILSAVLSAWFPARKAAQIEPAAAMRL